MPGIVGPYHALTESDRRGLVAMVGSGRSVRSAAGQLGCHYVHALNFCHAHGLPVVHKAKRVDRSGNQALQVVELVQGGLPVHQAATRCGMHPTAAYAVAIASRVPYPANKVCPESPPNTAKGGILTPSPGEFVYWRCWCCSRD